MNNPSAAHDPPELPESPDDAQDPRATEPPRPVGDAVPAPTEPGLDQPLPPKTKTQHERATDAEDEAADAPPNDISRPVGDAVPAPAEPGLDQPLPAKKSS